MDSITKSLLEDEDYFLTPTQKKGNSNNSNNQTHSNSKTSAKNRSNVHHKKSSNGPINTANTTQSNDHNNVAKNTNTTAIGRAKELKAEMHSLYLSEESVELIMDVLQSIHGKPFQLKNIRLYRDQGTRLKDHYWNDRGTLIVKSIESNFRPDKFKDNAPSEEFSSSANISLNENELKLRHFAIQKLKSYGFAENHCMEAYNHCEGSINNALKLLYCSYFCIEDGKPTIVNNIQQEKESTATNDCIDQQSLAARRDEKEVLASIYGESFHEKEIDRIWSLHFPIEEIFPSLFKKSNATKIEENTKGKGDKNRCRNFDKNGTCKFGSKCRFLHLPPIAGNVSNKNESDNSLNALESLEKLLFMEIHFSKNTKYPIEAPYIYIKTSNTLLSNKIRLKLMYRLYQEALQLAIDGQPSIYTIALYLQNIETSGEQWDASYYCAPLDNESIIKSQLSVEKEATSDVKGQTLDDRKLVGPRQERGQTSHSDSSNRCLKNVIQQNCRLIKKYLQKQQDSDSVYWKFLKKRTKLPAFEKKQEILDLLAQHQVIIVSGDTGCGKSTQIPQYILENWFEKASTNLLSTNSNNPVQLNVADRDLKVNKKEGLEPHPNHIEIICTQPRRLSAIGVAERVSTEQAERLGQLIGYQVRLENMISSLTRLTFCTTGIVLKRLISDPQLKSITHLILDEVHERSEEIDFLLMILKDLLKTRKDLKLIIMSATMNSESFSYYFQNASIVTIQGHTFPIQEYFLEDILDKCDYVIETNSPFSRKLSKEEGAALMEEMTCADVKFRNQFKPNNIVDEKLNLAALYARYADYSNQTCKTLYLLEPMKIDPTLIESVLKYIVNGDHNWPREGTILIFLPGFQEIYTVYDELNSSSIFGSRKGNYILVPLHSSLSSEEQVEVFRPAPIGKRKIVLSTNVAETSITIDDCVFVIDCGLKKENHFDTNRNMESLDLVWISKPNAQQRRGRAGRVMPGICIHLYTNHRYQQFLAQPIPEIHRVPLEHLLLRIKTLQCFLNQSVLNVVDRCIEPPSQERINDAIKRLQDIGALYPNQDLTPLGHHLASLSVDVRIGKLMLYGSIFQCLDSTLTIAACLSHKSPFVSPYKERAAANIQHLKFATANSDHLTCLKAYKQWLAVMKTSNNAGKQYASENYLSMKTLKTISELKYQYLEQLVEIGFVPIDVPRRRPNTLDNILQLTGPDLNKNCENNNLLISLLCAALLPNIVKILMPERTYVRHLGGAVPQQLAAKQLRFQTRRDGFVAIHPSSVNAQQTTFSSSFIVFQEKVRTSRVFIRECSLVPVMSLVLFSSGTDLRIELHDGDFLFLLEDCWIVVKAQNQLCAELMKCLRLELFKLLEEKIRDPGLNLLYHANSRKIINTINHLITISR